MKFFRKRRVGRNKRILRTALICIVLFAGNAYGQTTAFKYEGSLTDGGSAATGNFQMQFRLFDSQFGGSQIGATLSDVPVTATAGIFSVSLDFGTSAFGGGPRWLEISVRRSPGEPYTLLSPREQITSSPYAVKTISASQADALSPACVGCVQNSHINSIDGAKVTGPVANAITATTAVTAASFTGPLAGDVTGNQAATVVNRLQGRNVASTAPNNGQVLKFNTANGSWEPSNDETATSGGGGTITGVTAGTGLTGGGTTGSVTVGIANGGVTTAQLADGSVNTSKLADNSIATTKLADGSVTNSKVVSVDGAKVTGTVANATNAATATNSTQLGGVAAANYLQTNGNGSGLTNLNASSIATGTLNNARLGQIPTANIADNAVTANKIAPGQAVKSVNGLTDNVTLTAGSNVTITPSGNTLTIASTGGAGGLAGNGTIGRIPMFTGTTSIGDSNLFQSGGNVGVGLNPQSQFHSGGTGWFSGDTTPLPSGAGRGVAIGQSGDNGYLFSFNYANFTPRNLILNGPGGSVGVGTTLPENTLDVNGFLRAFNVAGGNVVSESKGGINSWAKHWMITPSQRWSVGTSNGFNGNQLYFSNENPGVGGIRMAIMPDGNVGIGTAAPNTRLTLNGGSAWTSNGWTASLNLQNVSALGWEANASGQRFGIGQSGGGLYFFRTTSGFGNSATPANYDLVISDSGNVGFGGNTTQELGNFGLPKATVFVLANGTIGRCYNGVNGTTAGNCGFSVSGVPGQWEVNFGFNVTQSFFSLTSFDSSTGGVAAVSQITGRIFGYPTQNSIRVGTFRTWQESSFGSAVAPSDFFLIVY